MENIGAFNSLDYTKTQNSLLPIPTQLTCPLCNTPQTPLNTVLPFSFLLRIKSPNRISYFDRTFVASFTNYKVKSVIQFNYSTKHFRTVINMNIKTTILDDTSYRSINSIAEALK